MAQAAGCRGACTQPLRTRTAAAAAAIAGPAPAGLIGCFTRPRALPPPAADWATFYPMRLVLFPVLLPFFWREMTVRGGRVGGTPLLLVAAALHRALIKCCRHCTAAAASHLAPMIQ